MKKVNKSKVGELVVKYLHSTIHYLGLFQEEKIYKTKTKLTILLFMLTFWFPLLVLVFFNIEEYASLTIPTYYLFLVVFIGRVVELDKIKGVVKAIPSGFAVKFWLFVISNVIIWGVVLIILRRIS